VKSATAVAAQPPSTSPQQLCGFVSPRLCVEGSAAVDSHGGTEGWRSGQMDSSGQAQTQTAEHVDCGLRPAAVRSLRELCGSVRDRCSAAIGSHGGGGEIPPPPTAGRSL
jgi:hypothetical protein